ncbi:extracellular solute-binding protein, partial [Pseudomonas sp. SB113]
MLRLKTVLTALAFSAAAVTPLLAEDLTIYSHWPRERIEALVKAFNEVHPEVNVQYFRSGNAALATIFTTEMEQDVGRADYITSDVDFMEQFKDAGYLEANRPSSVDELVPEATDPDGYW